MPEENDNDIKKFDYNAFASDLSQQASSVIPGDIKEDDKKFIVSIILKFCTMAGEALTQEANSQLGATGACLVTQFIGEWIFHKSIDIIRSGIDAQYRESILQKIAFTVFDIAKRAIEKDMPQDQIISLVEAQVNKSFQSAIEDLTAKGKISAQIAENAKSQSNIDAMVENEVSDEVTEEDSLMSNSKMIKLASLAIFMKNFSKDRIKNILQNFNKPERDVLMGYLKMPDLEEKLDVNAAMKCFEEMKNALPETVVVSYDKAYKKLYKIVKNSSKNVILDIIKEEKPAIQEYVLSCYNSKKKKLPAYIADTVSKYLEEKAV